MAKLDNLFEEAIFLTDKIARTLDTQEDKHYAEYRDSILSLKERYGKKILNVLIAGEVSVGKSTFVNTLLKEDVCETAEETCTNAASVIKYGETEKVTVYFNPTEDDSNPAPKQILRSQIKEYTSEKWNSKNKKEARLIEIEIPNDVLKEGIVIIDTPGLGAIEPKHAVATYGIAPIADIIFFLGSTIRQLSSFEINHLKRLIECSKCDNIVHVLTKTDQGNPKVIMDENREEINKVLPDKEISFFGVSSVLYNDYLSSNDEDDLIESGFKPLLEYIALINEKIQGLLDAKYKKILMSRLVSLHSDVKTISDAANNPTTAEERLKKLKELIERLEELEDQNHRWRSLLSEGFGQLEIDSTSRLNNEKYELRSKVDSLLEIDSYLKNPDEIGYTLQADMVCFLTTLKQFVQDRITKIHSDIVQASELDKIRKEIHTNKLNPDEDVHIEDEWDFERFATTVRIYVISVAGTSAVGATIGGMLGGPVGFAIGGALGAFVGWLSAKFISKNEKRRRIKVQAYEAIDKFFNQLSLDMKSLLLGARATMSTSFEEEYRKEKKFCLLQKKQLEDIAGRDATYRSVLQKIVTAVENLISKAEAND